MFRVNKCATNMFANFCSLRRTPFISLLSIRMILHSVIAEAVPIRFD
jgi:hypothetical protein